MIIEVVEFNKKRNNLELDRTLELNMINEEIHEFWDATTVAERVDAFVDTEYVWIGTQVKYSFNGNPVESDFTEYVNQSLDLMGSYLAEELGEKANEVIYKARKIVCDANARKGTKRNKDGKVEKGKEYSEKIDATKEIALMIEEVTKPTEY